MKNFTDLCSPVSWLIFVLLVYGGIVVTFTPTLNEIFIFMLVDTLAIIPATLVEQIYFLRIFPQFKLFFPKLQLQEIEQLDSSAVKQLFIALKEFPKKRVQYVFYGNLLKIMPAALVVIYYWSSPISAYAKALKFLLLELFAFTFLYSIEFVEFYTLVNKTTAKIQDALGSKRVFGFHEQSSTVDTSFFKAESISLLFLPLWAISLSTAVVFLDAPFKSNLLGLKMFSLGICFVAVGGRIYILYRNYFKDGLTEILTRFKNLHMTNEVTILPLHSDPILGNVEQTFNDLSVRLYHREKEISELTTIQIEQSRFQALGEMAGLVAHDLAGPVQIISFCTEALVETPIEAIIQEPKRFDLFISKLKINAERCIELISSLKAYVRNPDQNANYTNFFEAHGYVWMLLNTQFRIQNFEKSVHFDIHPELKNILLPISRGDLVHILYNLYKNSVENFKNNKISQGLIRIYPLDQSMLKIIIEDNGTGLSPNLYNEITGYHQNFGSDFRKGLGLRLTRRLVERCGGTLEVLEKQNGSLFMLKLSGEILVKNAYIQHQRVGLEEETHA